MATEVRRSAAPGWVAAALLAGACASAGPRPGTGDLSFRLAWEGEADLDLYVLSPLGERINFLHRDAPSGGLLDIDCNVTVSEPVRTESGQTTLVNRKTRCPTPLENIYWPRGGAPAGVYRIQVVLADGEGALLPDRYRLEIRFGRSVVQRLEGGVLELDLRPLARLIAFPAGASGSG